MIPRYAVAVVAFLLVSVLPVGAGDVLPKMRPYSGIGIVAVPLESLVGDASDSLPKLYAEPGISRIETKTIANAPRYEWIFAMGREAMLPLIVMARRGEWFKIVYDEAGREGWITLPSRQNMQSWEEFWVERVVRRLPGLAKRYYQMYDKPGAEPLPDVEPGHLFRARALEGDWIWLQDSVGLAGWVRWRDDDGRLLIGLGRSARTEEP